jgi:transposase
LAENPEKAFSGNGNKCKDQARIAELERLLGQAHAKIDLLKKTFAMRGAVGSDGRTDSVPSSSSA